MSKLSLFSLPPLDDISIVGILAALSYLFGLVCAVFALWRSRTPQGAAAWVVGLLSLPFIAIPLFLIFGHNKFIGYVKQRRELDQEAQKEIKESEKVYSEQVAPPEKLHSVADIVSQSQQPALTGFNQIELLIDAEPTYTRMFQDIEKAKKYILFQFYVFRDDEIGNKFVELLIKKAKEGVKVYFLCDKIGTHISLNYLKKLRAAGIEALLFESTKTWANRWQINFRNHRKILIVDGKIVFVGGINIGDDYLGKWISIGHWRDTQVRLVGPSALAAQLSFVKDWYWSTEQMLDLDWDSHQMKDGSPALLVHTGPADRIDTCLLLLVALINSATKRIWIATPYFVPPESLTNALVLASLRGLDVRILLPSYSDNRWVQYASETYQDKLLRLGVKFFKYLPGFLHQKVILIDEDCASVGSANMDSRSIFINFEMMAISPDPKFAKDVEKMLEADFSKSQEINLESLEARTFAHQLLARATNLMAPIL